MNEAVSYSGRKASAVRLASPLAHFAWSAPGIRSRCQAVVVVNAVQVAGSAAASPAGVRRGKVEYDQRPQLSGIEPRGSVTAVILVRARIVQYVLLAADNCDITSVPMSNLDDLEHLAIPPSHVHASLV